MRSGCWTSKINVKLRFWGVNCNLYARNGYWTSKIKIKLQTSKTHSFHLDNHLLCKILCCCSLEGTSQVVLCWKKWQLWGSNPRPYGLAPEASALDHSAKLSWTPTWHEYKIAFSSCLQPLTIICPSFGQCPYRLVVFDSWWGHCTDPCMSASTNNQAQHICLRID